MTFLSRSVNLGVFEILIFNAKDTKIRSLLSSANEHLLKVYRLYPQFFICIFIAYFLVRMSFEWALVHLTPALQGPWMLQIFAAVVDILFGAVLLFAYGFSLQNVAISPTTLDDFLTERLAPLITESLLAFSRIILLALLFIIPGLVYYVFYTFMPYIVFFDPKYHAGEVNALGKSKRIVKSRFFRVLGFVIITGTISLALELTPKVLGLTRWWQEIWFSAAVFYFGGFTFMLFYELYKRYEEKT